MFVSICHAKMHAETKTYHPSESENASDVFSLAFFSKYVFSNLICNLDQCFYQNF